jgi:hypothetical protein
MATLRAKNRLAGHLEEAGKEGVVPLVEPGQARCQAEGRSAGDEGEVFDRGGRGQVGAVGSEDDWTGGVSAVFAVSARSRRRSMMRVWSCGWR